MSMRRIKSLRDWEVQLRVEAILCAASQRGDLPERLPCGSIPSVSQFPNNSDETGKVKPLNPKGQVRT